MWGDARFLEEAGDGGVHWARRRIHPGKEDTMTATTTTTTTTTMVASHTWRLL
jgi:hypothetical protein